MEFRVEPIIFQQYPGLCLPVAVAQTIDNTGAHPAVAAAWHEAWASAGRASVNGNAQSHPRIQPWRERFRLLGVSGKEFPSSAEALLRRALKGNEPFRINPLVDFYNTISLRHSVPAGGFDLGQVDSPLELRLTRAGDEFTALDDATPLPVAPGEVAYADAQTILTRHFVWRQAKAGLITSATREVFLVAEVLGEVGRSVAEAVRTDFVIGLRNHFAADCVSFLVDEQNPVVEW